MSPTKLPEWAAFMAAIVADPNDDTVRLVAADFLEENGDPDRTAFIRIQVRISQIEADGEGMSRECTLLREKEQVFLGPLSTYRRTWAAEACPELVSGEGVDPFRWRRGFIDGLRCSAKEWHEHGADIRTRLPLVSATLTECSAVDSEAWWLMLPSLHGLRFVALMEGGLSDEFLLGWLRMQLPDVRISHIDTHSGGINFPPRLRPRA